MKKLLFVLYDTKGYMPFLAEYLSRKSFLLECRLFTKIEGLNDFLEENKIDVLLLGQEVDCEKLSSLEQVKHVVILSEEDETADNQSFPMVFKYQSAETVVEKVFQIVEKKKMLYPPAETGESKTAFYALFRPYGDFSTTQKLMEENGWSDRKCLILNLELLNGLEQSGDQGKAEEHLRGMSELIFYLKQQKSKVALKLETLIRRIEGADYLYPVEDYRDLYSINREDVDHLLAVLSEETDYEIVVFDVGYLSDASLYLLYCCDLIYIPEAGNPREENQKKSLERLLGREGMGEVLEHIQYVSV